MCQQKHLLKNRAVLGEEISLAEPEVLAFITGQVAEGIAECCPAPEKL